jgi:hypothetical protein
MDHGRRRLWATWHATGCPEVHPTSPAVSEVARGAAAKFWLLLHDFAAGCTDLPKGWGSVGPAHPFLFVQPGQPQRVQVVQLAALHLQTQLEPDLDLDTDPEPDLDDNDLGEDEQHTAAGGAAMAWDPAEIRLDAVD